MWNYDVFISFRGEDTRNTFVYDLYSALEEQGIYTYKDDEALLRGESIGPSLLKAIEEAQTAVIVFSENYADSSWCLDELEYIIKCRDKRDQIVLPIFYDMEPSNVRTQKGKYEEAFAKHETENKNKVESWRKALADASNISGWVLKHIPNRHDESKCIKEIVDTISHRLLPVIPRADDNLIGVEARVLDLKSKLQIGSRDVHMIGIWGVGGGGKTTLAYSVYCELSREFTCRCFVKNIRDESSKNGLEKLQEKILCCISKQNQVKVPSLEEGKGLIKRMLFCRKVLIVLDDVNDIGQLEALAGSRDWFGEESQIIITTRDNHLLNAHNVNVIHNISLLDDYEAIKLFRKFAHGDYWHSDYELLAKDVVSYAGGLPLALKVLGSFLCDKDINEWKSALARLKSIPDIEIVEKLKISYDGLNSVEKELFLDIVCFFRGEKKDMAMEILDACDFHSVIGLKVLIQKALITISDGKLDMHDLVQEMGHYIVRGEHSKNPEKHTRVWLVEDVTKICAMDATMELGKIEAIRIISDMCDPLPRHNHHVVANMKKLRWIDWRGHHASSLPTNFPPRELCCLILSGGHLRQLWNSYMYLPCLKMIKLHDLKNLIMTPDFGGLPNLERFLLNRSPSLEEIHPSIGHLQRLVFLLITGCDNLKMFPSITGIKKLETLSLSKCSKVSKSGKQVASYKKYSTKLFVACLPCCLKEPFLLHKVMNLRGLQFISRGLRKLILSNCHLGDEDIDSDVWELSNLQELRFIKKRIFTIKF